MMTNAKNVLCLIARKARGLDRSITDVFRPAVWDGQVLIMKNGCHSSEIEQLIDLGLVKIVTEVPDRDVAGMTWYVISMTKEGWDTLNA